MSNESKPDNSNIRLQGWSGTLRRRLTSVDRLLPHFEPPPPLPRAPQRTVDELIDGKPEEVFHPDERRRIIDPAAYPYSAICALTILNRKRDRYYGTGFLAGPRLVITAGHNVYFHDDGGFMSEIQIYPGLNGNREQPVIGSTISRSFATVEAWRQDASSQFDFGAIFLDHDLSQAAGFLSVSKFTSEFLNSMTVTLSGYPKDPPENSGFANNGSTQWRAAGRMIAESNRLRYTIDSSVGQSGSPMVAFFPERNEYHAVGIHNTAYVNENAATRINNEVFAQLVQWRQHSDAR